MTYIPSVFDTLVGTNCFSRFHTLSPVESLPYQARIIENHAEAPISTTQGPPARAALDGARAPAGAAPGRRARRVRAGTRGLGLPDMGGAAAADDDAGPVPAAGAHDAGQRGRGGGRGLRGGRDGGPSGWADRHARGVVPVPAARAAATAASVPVRLVPGPCAGDGAGDAKR